MDNLKYLIKVDIHEVKDVIFKEPKTEKEIVPNLNITVSVNSNQHSTVVREKTSNSTFNSNFTFGIDLNQCEFQRTRILITLYHNYMFKAEKIGHHAFSLPLIYSKQQHCIYRSWVRVFNPDYPTHNAGSLLTSICVSAPGDKPPIFKDNEELSGTGLGSDPDQTGIRLNKVPQMNLKSYMLYVNVVCGRDFKPQAGLLYSSLEPYVKISHFGLSEQTHIIRDIRDPEWQTTLYLPCITPSYDELVTVEVWNGDSNSALLHFESIDLIHLINNEYPPRWINIYYQPKRIGVVNTLKNYVSGGADDSSLTDYGGRILISASAEQVQTLYCKGSKPCRSISVPPIQQRIIAVDLYEIVSLVQTPNIVNVVVSHGPFSTKSSKYLINQNGSYKINDKNGRLTPLEPIFSSNDDGDVWDLFIYVYDVTDWGGDNSTRVAWNRISYEKAKASEGSPMWINLMSFQQKYTDMFNILISFEISSNVTGYQRKNRLEYSLTKYIFRSMLYEALHLPCTENDSYPSSYVEIELGGYTIKSKVVKENINPYFFESNELEILLPTNLLLAPDINISVYAEPNTVLGRRELICSGQYSLENVPKEWKRAPQWLKLKSTINPLHRPKILIAFELLSYQEYMKNPERYTYFEDILPSTIPSILSLLLIGIRTFKPLKNPKVEIKFRDYDSCVPKDEENEETENTEVVGSTGKPVSGCYGNWNFLSSHAVNLELPKRMHHHSYLELDITCDNVTGVFGTTILTLNQFLPWLSEEEKSTSVELFRIQCMDDFNSVEQSKKEVRSVEKKMEDIKNINFQILEKIDLVSHQKSKFNQDNQGQLNRISSSASTNEGDQREENKETEEQEEKKETKEADKQNEEDELDFEIMIEDNVNEIVREELPYEMESEFDCEDLPYMKAPIVKFTKTGIPEVIGTVKFILSITDMSKKKSQSKQNKELATIRERIETQKRMLNDLYSQAKDLVVRTYILEAKGLYSTSIVSNTSSLFMSNLTGDVFTYVWIRNVDQETQSYQSKTDYTYDNPHSRNMGYPNGIKDSNNSKRGLKPVYNACYNVSCSLPENSILKISIISKGTVTEEIVGTTYIDCEDRFFNKNLQKLMLEDCAPIESRTLRTYGAESGGSSDLGEITMSHGILRLWIEMMDLQTAKMKPVQNLGSLEPTNYELRVVIWKIKYFSEDNSSMSFLVKGTYIDDQNENSQKTETHYHSKDKTGTFNWRFKFPISIPTEYTNFKLQLYRHFNVSEDELLGETNVDLAFEFHKVRKKSKIHTIPKFTISIYSLHDSNKVVGSIEVEMSILNEGDSKRYPVGFGREAPNRDPFLPEVLENRSWMDVEGIKDTIMDATNRVIMGVKYTGWIVLGGVIFALIILIIILFK